MAPKKYNKKDMSKEKTQYILRSLHNHGYGYFLGLREAKTRRIIDKRICYNPNEKIIYIEESGGCDYLKTSRNTVKQFVERFLLEDIVERFGDLDISQLAKPIHKTARIHIRD